MSQLTIDNKQLGAIESSMFINLVKGDITQVKADAIVNAASTTLLGGGGVDGAIHQAAGPELLRECRTLGGCKTGDAKITKGYNLPAKYVIHTVGPVWRGGSKGESELLRNCYLNSLAVAEKYRIKSIAFPAISTGAYGFPKEEAAKIAIETVRSYPCKSLKKIIFVLHSEEDFQIYKGKFTASTSSSDRG